MRILFILVLFISLSLGRENPFIKTKSYENKINANIQKKINQVKQKAKEERAIQKAKLEARRAKKERYIQKARRLVAKRKAEALRIQEARRKALEKAKLEFQARESVKREARNLEARHEEAKREKIAIRKAKQKARREEIRRKKAREVREAKLEEIRQRKAREVRREEIRQEKEEKAEEDKKQKDKESLNPQEKQENEVANIVKNEENEHHQAEEAKNDGEAQVKNQGEISPSVKISFEKVGAFSPRGINELPIGSYKLLPKLNISFTNNTFFIYTKYKVYKKFVLKRERKIVFDFKAHVNFYTRRNVLNSENFKHLTIGSHKGGKYLRVVINVSKNPNSFNIGYSDKGVIIEK